MKASSEINTSSRIPLSNLTALSLVFLAFPYLIFLIYLHSIWSVIGFAGIIAGLFWLKSRFRLLHSNLTRQDVIIISVVTISLCLITGNIPGIGTQSYDWVKHNTILNDLVTHNWPVQYGNGQYLNYYLAYYLPAALVGKLLHSYVAAQLTITLDTIIGFALMVSLCWQILKPRLSLARGLVLLSVLFGFSGWDWLYWLLQRGIVPHFPNNLEFAYIAKMLSLQTWKSTTDVVLQYGSLITNMVYVPQHFLPAILGVALFLINKKLLLLVIVLSLLWSPFSAMGLTLIYVFSLVAELASDWKHYRHTNWLQKLQSYPARTILELAGGCLFMSLPVIIYFLHHAPTDRQLLLVVDYGPYFFFIVTELFSLLLLIAVTWSKQDRVSKILLSLIVIVLIILPLFRIGACGFNDLIMRIVIPCFILILLLCLPKVFSLDSLLLRTGIIVIMLAGILVPMYEVGFIFKDGSELRTPAADITRLEDRACLDQQYLGNGE